MLQSLQEVYHRWLAHLPLLYQRIDRYDDLSSLEVNLLMVIPDGFVRPRGFSPKLSPPLQVLGILPNPAIQHC